MNISSQQRGNQNTESERQSNRSGQTTSNQPGQSGQSGQTGRSGQSGQSDQSGRSGQSVQEQLDQREGQAREGSSGDMSSRTYSGSAQLDREVTPGYRERESNKHARRSETATPPPDFMNYPPSQERPQHDKKEFTQTLI